jgi:hypothetical protein
MTNVLHLKLLALLLASVAFASGGELEQLVAARQAAAGELRVERARGQRRVAELRARKERLREDLADSKTALVVAEKTQEDAQSRLAGADGATAAAGEQLEAWRQSAIDAASQLRQRIVDGIPFDREERLAQLDVVLTALNANESPERTARAVVSLLTFCTEELALVGSRYGSTRRPLHACLPLA